MSKNKCPDDCSLCYRDEGVYDSKIDARYDPDDNFGEDSYEQDDYFAFPIYD